MLFGTDGIRGQANQYPMTVELVGALGQAIGSWLRNKKEKNRVVIGKDTRLSGYMFENALVAGLCSMGVDTLIVGPLPTPGVAFITRAYRADAGIVISASHNPFHDNGIKIFSQSGFKISDVEEKEIEEMLNKRDFIFPPAEEVGRNKRIDDAGGRYIEFVKSAFPRDKSLKGLKLFLDCAHGAGYRVAPSVFWELKAEMIVTGTEPNGLNINAGVGSLHPGVMQKGVREHHADVGIALDGDGDRVIMVDHRGRVIDGDILLAMCAHYLKKQGRLKHNRVVATVMTNYGVIQFLRQLGIEVFLSQVGDRYVLQQMLEHKAYLGGEQSGHLIFLEHNTTGDGVLSALQVLKIMVDTQHSLATLAAGIKKVPQVLLNIPVRSKPNFEGVASIQASIRDVERVLQGEGKVLVRYSGTEDICRVMVEGPGKRQIFTLAEQIAATIRKELG